MEDINLNSLMLCTFDRKNVRHIEILKELNNDETITKRFRGFLSPLLSKGESGVFNRGFLVLDNNIQEIVGFIDIGAYNKRERCLYLRSAVLKRFRGQKYGKRILEETTDYLFQNFPQLESIRLTIAKDNISSLFTAASCGYEWNGECCILHNYINNNKTHSK